MEPSTPASAGKPKTGDVEVLTEAKATTLAQAWISAKNRIAHFTPEPNQDDTVQRAVLSSGPALGDVLGGLFAVVEPWLRHRNMVRAARELGVSRKMTKVLLQRFEKAWPGTRELTYAEQVEAIARALRAP